MSLYPFAEWLENSAGSVAFRESLWVYPIVETTHVLSLCVVFGLTVMWDLRLAGMTLRRVPVSDIGGRLLPWAVAGFVISAITGTLLVISSPVRITHNIFFRFKVVMLILAGLNVWMFHTGVYRRVAEWNLDAVAPKKARVAGVLSLVLWASVIVFGRMIAYNWFDCDRQPQAAIVNLLAGCRVGPQ